MNFGHITLGMSTTMAVLTVVKHIFTDNFNRKGGNMHLHGLDRMHSARIKPIYRWA